MSAYSVSTLLELANFVSHLCKSRRGTYAVLGSEGDNVFVELATNNLYERTILCTVWIGFSTTICGELKQRIPDGSEMTLMLPDFSYLIGLLSLLTQVLGHHVEVLHPLDKRGDYIEDWQNAVTYVQQMQL